MGDFFVNLMTASLHGGIIIAAIGLLRLCLKKAPRKWICLLWLLAAVRLVLPFAPESSFSLQPDIDTPTQSQTDTDPGNLSQQPEPDYDPVTPIVPETEPDTPVINVPETEPNVAGTTPNEAPVQTPATVDSATVAAWVWLTGAVALCLYSAISFLQLKKQVRSAVIVEEGVWQCPNLDTPFVLGFFRPQIYLTAGMNSEQWEFVLRHERCHIRRLDHWWKALGFAILAMHWFNPLVWLAYVLLCQDLETACDEAVVKDMDLATRKAYSLALLSCSAKRRIIAACPVAFGEISVKRRIKNVLSYKKPKLWITLLAIVAIVFVAVCFLTDPISDDEPNPSETQSAETTAPRQPRQPDALFEVIWNTYPNKPDEITTWEAYLETSEYWRVFRYTGELAEHPGEVTIDTSAMDIDLVYFVDFETGKIVQITDSPALTIPFATSEHIYYVLESEPTKVWRCDYAGENRTVVYESEYGSVTHLQFYGSDAGGKLILCEDRNRIVSYDMTTGELYVLMVAYRINQFYYSPSSLNDFDFVYQLYEDELGPLIFWTGALNEGDADRSYYYLFSRDRHWDNVTWECINVSVTVPGYTIPDDVDPETTVPDETPAPVETTEGNDVTDPTEFTMPDWGLNETPDNLVAHVYHAVSDAYLLELGCDTTGCTEDALYVFDTATGRKTLITESSTIESVQTLEYLFYVTEADPTHVIRSSYDGTEQVVCYTASYADITDLISICPDGTVYLVEGNQYVVEYDFVNDSAQLIFEYENINMVHMGFINTSGKIAFWTLDGNAWIYDIATQTFSEGPEH